MARARHVKKARKPNSVVTRDDINRANNGEEGAASYWWWAFRYGGKHFSKTRPRASQLTGSEYLSQLYALQERLEDLADEASEDDEVGTILDDIADEIRSLGDDCSSKRDNMPESLQDGDAGQLLETRFEFCERLSDELEDIDTDRKEDEDWNDYLERIRDEALACDWDCE